MAVKKTKKKLIEGQEYTIDAPKNPGTWQNRVLLFVPNTGNFRVEWVQARYGQIIPTNWSTVESTQILSSFMPIEYQLADAQNLMARSVVENDFEWIIYIESDNIIPPDTFIRFNEYMNEGSVPVVSGLYFTKSDPPEPILYRGRGNSFYDDWKLGDKVWVDGIPFGCRLEHASLIKAAWEDAPEYLVGNTITRRVFDSPNMRYFDEKKGGMVSKQGTSDLQWCNDIMEKHFEAAGWKDYVGKKNPFLVDTDIYVKHIDPSGRMYPLEMPERYIP